MKKTTLPIAPKASTLELSQYDGLRDDKTAATVGDLIVALTDGARRFACNEKDLYEMVAYLLETRLNRRRCSRYFWKLCANLYVPAVLKILDVNTHNNCRHETSKCRRRENKNPSIR